MRGTEGISQGTSTRGGRVALLLSMACLAWTLFGCFFGGRSVKVFTEREPADAVIFGYFDLKQAPSGLSGISFERMNTNDEARFYGCAVRRNAFYNTRIDPGRYRMSSFRLSGNFFTSGFEYQSRSGDSIIEFEVAPRSITFVGSYRYLPQRSGFLGPRRFDMVPASEPSEREVMDLFIHMAKGTDWEQEVQAHYARLP